MEKRMNRRAQDLSIGTLILIVLGIIVLVLLVLGFSLGWSNLWEKVNIFGGGSSLDSIITACNVAATSNNQYNFCQDFKKVKINSNIEYVNCLDSRIRGNIDKQLDCPDNYKDQLTSATSYCTILQGDSKFTNAKKEAIINGGKNLGGVTCAATPLEGTPDATKVAAAKTACEGICTTFGATPTVDQQKTYCCTANKDIGLSTQASCKDSRIGATCTTISCGSVTCPA